MVMNVTSANQKGNSIKVETRRSEAELPFLNVEF